MKGFNDKLAIVSGILLALQTTPVSAQAVQEIPLEVLYGSRAEVRLPGMTVEAELLAVDGTQLWVQDAGRAVSLDLAEISRVRIERHKWDAGRIVLWNVIAGLSTGLALTAACGTVDDANCGPVLPSWALAWGLVGGISGYFVARTSRLEVPANTEALRPFVRFPQGLPPDYGGRRP